MPTYDYRCEACGHTFEQFQSITAEPIKVCPECNKAKVRRLIGTGAALLFKGSGFYTTDYRSPTYNNGAKADSPSSSSSSSDGNKSSSATPSSNGNGASSAAAASGGSNGGSAKGSSGNGASPDISSRF
jgi:putative FmdB family regulatory protein